MPAVSDHADPACLRTKSLDTRPLLCISEAQLSLSDFLATSVGDLREACQYCRRGVVMCIDFISLSDKWCATCASITKRLVLNGVFHD